MPYLPDEFGEAVILLGRFIQRNPYAEQTAIRGYLQQLPLEYDNVAPLLKLLEETCDSQRYKATIMALMVEAEGDSPLGLNRCMRAVEHGYEHFESLFPEQITLNEQLEGSDRVTVEEAVRFVNSCYQPV